MHVCMFMFLSIYVNRVRLLQQYKILTVHGYTETAENKVDILLSFQNSCH